MERIGDLVHIFLMLSSIAEMTGYEYSILGLDIVIINRVLLLVCICFFTYYIILKSPIKHVRDDNKSAP